MSDLSDRPIECQEFEEDLLRGGAELDLEGWHSHLETCESCRQQGSMHQLLVACLAEVPVPELSPGFEAGLRRKLEERIEVRPLRGWRVAAMAAYAFMGALLLRWVFGRFPLPSIAIDPASPWILGLALLAVPLTLWLAIGATRWLPSGRGGRTSSLGLL